MDASLVVRPNKPDHLVVHQRTNKTNISLVAAPKMLSVDKSTECHVTPDDIAFEMVSYLDDFKNKKICEPESGTGQILQAMFDHGINASQITAIEKQKSLTDFIKNRFIGHEKLKILNSCFIEYGFKNKNKFDAFIMNPPFKTAKKHIQTAFESLKNKGVIIALVPSTFNFEKAETLRELDKTVFKFAKVNTKIIRIIK